ncbi:DUF188 domain-containing protein [Bacillaceae bacterium Marseille-Q3522]|nr:DUF188 domain-containing protein [Bacillaceae bacterium Marseille-Q3522]
MEKQIFVDADSCPVKDEIVEITKSIGIRPCFVASYAHVTDSDKQICWKYVDSSKEAADLYILNHVKTGDIVITQDTGLASILTAKKVISLSPDGHLFTEKEMQKILELRYLSAKARRQGIYDKGKKPFSNKERQKFVQQFTKILSNFAGI